MDPFSDEEDAEPVPLTPARARRPWWKWNSFTLAGTLFLALWVRELGNLPLDVTGLLVATIFAMWVLVPVALTGMPLLTPLPDHPGYRLGKAGTRRRAGRACRIAAVLVGSVGLVQACITASWIFSQAGSFRPLRIWWQVFLSAGWGAGFAIVLAIGLWTIGGIAAQVDRLAQLEAERNADR